MNHYVLISILCFGICNIYKYIRINLFKLVKSLASSSSSSRKVAASFDVHSPFPSVRLYLYLYLHLDTSTSELLPMGCFQSARAIWKLIIN